MTICFLRCANIQTIPELFCLQFQKVFLKNNGSSLLLWREKKGIDQGFRSAGKVDVRIGRKSGMEGF